jgi:Ran-binding protein 3
VNSTPGADQSEETTITSEDGHLFATAVLTTTKASPATDISNDENVSKSEEENSLTQSSDTAAKDGEQKTDSLVEAARKYEEMRGAQKRKYEEVEVTTGEEDERNILEINCKLFTFIENNYEERGRGILRLNDSKGSSHSRVVFRSSGSLRLLLNTKVWKDQICEQPSQKSLRLTAFDTNGIIKIYLAMGRIEDMSLLHRALSLRIQRAKDRTPEPESSPQEENSTADGEDDDGTDEPAIKRVASGSE